MKKAVFATTLGAALLLTACGESDIETNSGNESSNNAEANAAEENEEVDNEPEENNSAENDADEDNNENNAENEANEEVEEEGQEEESISIGDTITFDGLAITLNDAYTSDGNDFETPNNDHYVILDMTIENTTDEEANISTMLQMSLQDDESYTHDVTIYTDTTGTLDGEIGAGRDVRGEVAFDVNDSDTYEFIFENPFTSGQAIWEIEVN
ncbi:DUF4352 domain-containing protein [Alkalicoccus luteus]|uniref:DUF4352 domain-containing protein n=1 Tax=Alkalicoccus luteus TaxID=1237094 RepID=A0A969PPD9_9BACI|nr:DUF4352 domain-containing protein [Alkalicoccus luteus]NJP37940.1 DUF4352 domain-containing protein [Alkalicoccus luteus]